MSKSFIRGDFTLKEVEEGGGDVNCPLCSHGYQIQKFPGHCGLAQVSFPCIHCGWTLTLEMKFVPRFRMDYAWPMGDDPKEDK